MRTEINFIGIMPFIMTLQDYGLTTIIKEHFLALNSPFQLGRITCHYSNLYDVITEEYSCLAEPTGKLLYSIERKSEMPAVGDWVVVQTFGEDVQGIIHDILPRHNKFSRKASGKRDEEQTVVANLDILGIVTGLDDNFNVNRIERFLTLAAENAIKPLVILNKVDLLEARESIQKQLEDLNQKTDIVFTSAKDQIGLSELEACLTPGITAAFVGSSGVGKSSIINQLCPKADLATQEVREFDAKGRHTTTNKQMLVSTTGALVIDTPGMREVALWCDEDSVNETFELIGELAIQCKFSDCSHESEPGCAVQQAVESGEISEKLFDSYLKLRKEAAHISRKQNKETAANSKKRFKWIAKIVREEGFNR